MWCGVRFVSSHRIMSDRIALLRNPYDYTILFRIISHQDIDISYNIHYILISYYE